MKKRDRVDMIIADRISKSFGNQVVLESAYVELPHNSVIGLCGRNGAGKTTFIKILLDIYLPDSGVVIKKNNNTKIIFDMLPQFYSFKVKDFLTFFSLVYMDEKMEADELHKILERVNLQKYIDKKVSELSFGMQKLLYISTLLLGKTDFAIVDEPFNGLDPISISIVKEIIMELKQRYGATIVISSHLINELAEICEHFILIKDQKAHYINDISSISNTLKLTYKQGVNVLEDLKKFGVVNILSATSCELILKNNIRSTEVIKELVTKGILFDEIYYQNIFEV